MLWSDIAILALATSAASITISRSKLFSWPRAILPMLRCCYCVSHWVAAGLSCKWWSSNNSWGTLFVLWLAVVGLGALISGVILKIYSVEVENGR